MKHFEIADFPKLAEAMRRPYQGGYYAMYSSVFGGVVTDPALMMVPIDDHMVHRGDAVFETIKCVGGSLYALRAHLDRLARSAEVVGQKLPGDADGIARAVIETVRAGGQRDCLARLIVSRGPGSFGVDPYDCPEPQLYVVAYRLSPPFMEKHPGGARVRTSTVPAKPPLFAGIKNCNYLPNVLMKKEAVDTGVDFVVGFTEDGLMTEGPTENAGIVTRDKVLRFPRLGTILAGITMLRTMELGRQLVESGELKRTELGDITKQDVQQAVEFLIVGTTPNVTAACEFDGQAIGTRRPGPVYAKLSVLLQDDMRNNRELLTPVF